MAENGLVQGIPYGYSMPAEFGMHAGTIMVWPVRPGSFPFACREAKKTFVEMIYNITFSEPVYLICDLAHAAEASMMLNAKGIRTVHHHMSNLVIPKTPYPVNFYIYSTDDAWARDTAPTFIRNKDEKLIGIDWVFNAWGGSVDGLLPSWKRDDKVASEVCKALKIPRYDFHGKKNIAPGFVLEGGSIHTDGEGTLITTEACLLSKGRNPKLSKDEIGHVLKDVLGIKKIIWLPHGIYGDETNEHVDNVCAFTAPGRAVLAWCDDPDSPQYEYCRDDLKVLESECDAKDRKLEIIKLPVPEKSVAITEKELSGYVFEQGEDERELGEELAASYVNFYICNGAVLVPQFGDINDKKALDILAKEFPTRKIVPVKSRSILLGGGNIHCVTSQVPEYDARRW